MFLIKKIRIRRINILGKSLVEYEKNVCIYSFEITKIMNSASRCSQQDFLSRVIHIILKFSKSQHKKL